MQIRGVELGEITRHALLQLPAPFLDLRRGEVLVPIVEMLEARLLDLPYLLGNELLAFHVAAQFGERIGRDRLALRLTGAIHIYGGDFFAAERSEWDPETLKEGR